MHPLLSRLLAGAVLSLALLAVSGAQPNENLGIDSDCSALKLEAASGVPNGSKHSYRFSGTCVLLQVGISGGSKTSKAVLTFPVVVKVAWNAESHALVERLEVLGKVQWQGKPVTGGVLSAFKCNDDPVIRPATCNGTGQKNETGIDELGEAYYAQKPFTRGKASLAQASQLSASAGGGSSSPPPPKAEAPPPKRRPAALKSTDDIKVAPHLTIRSPKPAEVISSSAVHLEVVGPETLVHDYGVDAALLQWEWASATGASRNGLAGTSRWQRKDMMQQLKWTAREGHIFVASIDMPPSRFAEAVRWRVRARAQSAAVAPTAWIEFSVIPLP